MDPYIVVAPPLPGGIAGVTDAARVESGSALPAAIRMEWFDLSGAGAAPPLVLLHGAVLSRKVWLRQVRDLSDTRVVIAPDLPGHGTLAQVPFTFATAVTLLSDLIEVHGQGRAIVVGLSLGGYVAMALAERRPELVAGLVLSGCSVNPRGMLAPALRIVSALMRRGWVTMNGAQAEKKVRRLFPPDLADVVEAQVQAGLFPIPVGAAFREMAGRDFARGLAAYPGETLILNGQRDWFSRLGERRFRAASPRVRVEHVAGAGHACSLDRSAAFTHAVRQFAGTIGPP